MKAQYGTACSLYGEEANLSRIIYQMIRARVTKFNVYVFDDFSMVIIRQPRDVISFCALTGAKIESDGARYYPDQMVMP